MSISNLANGLLNKKIKSPFFFFLFLALLHSLLTFLAWYVHPIFSLLFFIPTITVISTTRFKKIAKHFHVYCFLLITNFIITYWLLDVNKADGVFALLINALYLYLSYPISLLLNKFFKNLSLSFIISYLLIEWLHFHWLFAWPWLTLGNVFGSNVFFIQWYRYTGVLGGSIWILLSNYYISKKKLSYTTFLIIIVPIIFSAYIMYFDISKGYKNNLNIILSQPNIGYKDSLNDNQRINKVIKQLDLFSSKKDSVNLLLLPELFLDGEYWKETFDESLSYNDLQKFIAEKFPNSTLLVGATLKKLKKSTRNFEFDKFNVIAIIDSSRIVKFKTKKEFIPKTENWPQFLDEIIPSPSSANYSLSADPNFFDVSNTRIFLAICYESTFEKYCSESLKVNSNVILLLASESFLKSNKTALKQYLNICKIRAIENQQYFIKCSNEGYSAVISPKGDIEQVLPNDKSNYMRCNIPLK